MFKKIAREFFLKGKVNKVEDLITSFSGRLRSIVSPEVADGSVEEVFCSCPVFVLSTGRCGTEYLTKLLAQSTRSLVVHDPEVNLEYVSSLLHSTWRNYEYEKFLFAAKFSTLASRYDYHFRRSQERGLNYIETNNRITFLADALSQMFPQAKFIHLIRNPAAFVRSGMRRGYYTSPGQVQRLNGDFLEDWNNMSQFQKICWEWNEINEYIEEFKGRTNKDRVLLVKSEDLFSDPGCINKVMDFCNIFEVKDKKNILEKFNKLGPANAQVSGYFPEINEWSLEMVDDLRRFCVLGVTYGYI